MKEIIIRKCNTNFQKLQHKLTSKDAIVAASVSHFELINNGPNKNNINNFVLEIPKKILVFLFQPPPQFMIIN